MNKYGARLMRQWQAADPERFALIPDPDNNNGNGANSPNSNEPVTSTPTYSEEWFGDGSDGPAACAWAGNCDGYGDYGTN